MIPVSDLNHSKNIVRFTQAIGQICSTPAVL